MAQGNGFPKLTQSGGAYPGGTMPGPGKPVPISKRDYKTSTPSMPNTAVTGQGFKIRSGR